MTNIVHANILSTNSSSHANGTLNIKLIPSPSVHCTVGVSGDILEAKTCVHRKKLPEQAKAWWMFPRINCDYDHGCGVNGSQYRGSIIRKRILPVCFCHSVLKGQMRISSSFFSKKDPVQLSTTKIRAPGLGYRQASEGCPPLGGWWELCHTLSWWLNENCIVWGNSQWMLSACDKLIPQVGQELITINELWADLWARINGADPQLDVSSQLLVQCTNFAVPQNQPFLRIASRKNVQKQKHTFFEQTWYF